MSRRTLRQQARVCYFEPEEPPLDEYLFCEQCGDYVFEYCAIHGPLLVIPDDKVPSKPKYPSIVPRAALTIPHVFLHLARSIIPGAGIGVFSTLTLPRGVRFGPYRGLRTDTVDSMYCWQIYDRDNKRSHVVDAADASRSNWMRYVNCSRHWSEQNLVAYQYKGQLYYRTIKIIPRFTELMVFYGGEFANILRVNLAAYNAPTAYAAKFGARVSKNNKIAALKDTEDATNNKRKIEVDKNKQTENITIKEPKIVTKKTKVVKPGTKESKIITKKSEIVKPTTKESKIVTKKTKVVKTATKELKIVTKETEVKKQVTTSKILETCDKVDIGKNKCYENVVTSIDNNVCEEKSINNTPVEHNVSSISISKNKQFTCDTSKNKPFSIGSLKRHIRIHTGEKPNQCNICNQCFSLKCNLKTHIRTHTGEKPYQCTICQKCFIQKSDLKKHIRTHTGDKPYQCTICQKCFNCKQHLEYHIRTHTGEKPYRCNICNQCFSLKCNLKIHIRTHTGEKPYQCNICNQCFNLKGHLKTHIRTHTGEKPYQCSICQKCFIQKSDLKKHIRTHTGEKPYECNICNQCFSRKDNLKIHIRTHTGDKPYQCTICQKCFNCKHHLEYHIRTHTGEKPYQCTICNQCFSQKRNLKSHIRTHTGEKPYQCIVCKKCFSHSSNYYKHIRIHKHKLNETC